MPAPASPGQSASLLPLAQQPIPSSPVPPRRVEAKAEAPVNAAEAPRVVAAPPAIAAPPTAPPRPRVSVPTPPDAVRIAGRPTEQTTRSIAAADPSRVQPPARRDTVIRPDTPAEAAPIAITRAPAKLDPTIEDAYAAFQRGETDKARQLYLRAAQSDPSNRDVQLGLAAVDLRSQNLTSAEGRYLKLLELDPRDSHALAGIMAIRGAGDPVQAESRVKTFLTHQPDASMLHFVLGNQYAAQARWNEAQQAYFRAYTADPENPDFAFNLAVSLDHIRQERVALDYYERALRLANGRQAAFDRTTTSTRIKELQR